MPYPPPSDNRHRCSGSSKISTIKFSYSWDTSDERRDSKPSNILLASKYIIYYALHHRSHILVPVVNEARHTDEDDSQFPVYGPIEAALGYVLYYVLIDRVTPAIVLVFSETVLDLSPPFVRFGLAIVLWFILVVVVVDQIRRQLAALGVVTYDNYQLRVWSRVTPPSLRTAGYLVALIAGTAIAVITFDRAVEALLSLIPVVATVDVVAFDFIGLFVMVVFFLAYSAVAHSLDRLVIDGIRTLASD